MPLPLHTEVISPYNQIGTPIFTGHSSILPSAGLHQHPHLHSPHHTRDVVTSATTALLPYNKSHKAAATLHWGVPTSSQQLTTYNIHRPLASLPPSPSPSPLNASHHTLLCSLSLSRDPSPGGYVCAVRGLGTLTRAGHARNRPTPGRAPTPRAPRSPPSPPPTPGSRPQPALPAGSAQGTVTPG
jgi:hypothetical protein